MIEIKNLKKSFYNNRKEQKIFNNVNVSFDNIGLTAIVAPSGTGKTTLFNMICCLDNEYDGTINYDGIKINNELVENKISYLMQDDNLFNNLSVFDNLKIYDEIKEQEIDEFLKKFDIFDLRNKKVSKLSGGQRRRVALVRSLLKKPKVLICDEPTSSLDKTNSIAVMNILKNVSKDILVIYSSHDSELVDKYSDNIFLLSDNNIICEKSNSYDKNVIVSSNSFTISKVFKHNIIKSISFSNYKMVFLSVFTLVIIFTSLFFCFSIFEFDIVKIQIDTMKHENDYILLLGKNNDDCHTYKRNNDDFLRLNDNNIYKDNSIISGNEPLYYINEVWFYFYSYNNKNDYGKYIGSYPVNKNDIMIYQLTAERLINSGVLQESGERIYYKNINDLIGKNIIAGESIFTVSGIITQDLDMFDYLKLEPYKVYDIHKYNRLANYFIGKYSYYSNIVLTTDETINELENNYTIFEIYNCPSFTKYSNYNDIEKDLRKLKYNQSSLVRDYYSIFGTHYSDSLEDFSYYMFIIKYIIKYCIPVIIMIILLVSYLLTRNILEKNSKNIALMRISGFTKNDVVSSFSLSVIMYYFLSFIISSALFICVSRVLCSIYTKLYYFYFDPFYIQLNYFIYLFIICFILSLISYCMINSFYKKMNTIKLTRNN